MLTRASVCGLGVVLLSAVFGSANAQSVDSLRQVKQQATETFLNAALPAATRLEAASRLGYPEDETFAELLRIGTDTNEDAAVRLVALKKYRYDDKYIDAVIAIISDTTEDETLASGLIDDFARRTTFRQPAQVRQRFQAALRDRLNDPRPAVRLSSYRALVSSHDAVAIDNLVESLRNGNPPPIPLKDAIELLDVDGPTKHVVTVRPYLETSDTAAQAQAARVLAVDPESRQSVVGLATNPETPLEVRLNALRALSREDGRFVSYAVKIMDTRTESADIRYEAMRTAMGRLNYHNEPAAIQIAFAEAVERLGRAQNVITSEGKNVGVEAQKLLRHLRRVFPAIRKHYLRRG